MITTFTRGFFSRILLADFTRDRSPKDLALQSLCKYNVLYRKEIVTLRDREDGETCSSNGSDEDVSLWAARFNVDVAEVRSEN